MHMYEYSYTVVKHAIQFYGTYTISDNSVKRKSLYNYWVCSKLKEKFVV